MNVIDEGRENIKSNYKEGGYRAPRYHCNPFPMQKRMNGFKDSHLKEIDKIETIELVLEDFGAMHIVNKFKGLKSLTLINCGIAVIEVYHP